MEKNIRNIVDTSSLHINESRFVLHMFDDGTKVKFRVDNKRMVHGISSSSKKANALSRVYRCTLCPHVVDTRELDFNDIDKWVVEALHGLWFRGGFNRYCFQLEEDAVLFKLTWGSEKS